MGDVVVTAEQVVARKRAMTEGTRQAVTTADTLLSLTTGQGGEQPEPAVLVAAAILLAPHTGGRERADTVVREAARHGRSLTEVWVRMVIEWETRATWLHWEVEVGKGATVHLEQDAEGYELGVTDAEGVYGYARLTDAHMDALVGVYLDHTGREAVPKRT